MAETIQMPKLGFDMAEGKLVRWVKHEGETVSKGEVLAEIETDKATVEVEASAGGVLRKLLVLENTSVPVGTPIAVVGTADESIDAFTTQAAPAETVKTSAPAPTALVGPTLTPGATIVAGEVRASPLARRMARERGVDLERLHGSGPGGRIVSRDLGSPGPAAGATGMASTAVGAGRASLTRLRSAVGRRMTASKQTIPHFYITVDLDAGPVMELRSELNSSLPEASRFSINDFIVKATALALRELPNLNASLDGDGIIRRPDVNVGVAVATPDGLLTVVVRGADHKPLRQVADELRDSVGRARQGRVRPEDIEGSTFTVSNLGMFDVDHFIAIINPPEAAILAVGGVREVPVVRDGAILTGRRMKVTLSADHRVTDGAEAAHWLQILRGYLEHPIRLLI
jgi:pyruvate dehydrogenase E2 component (dihydrolipoamide acetyltransferase)